MSQFISVEKAQLNEYQTLVPLFKAKVALGNRAKKNLNHLGKSMEGLLVSDIFKQLSQREQKLIDNNMDNEADAAFEDMKKKLGGYGKKRRSTLFFKQNEQQKIVKLSTKIKDVDNNIYLERKYVNSIATRLEAIQEITKVQNEKRKLRHWRNQQFNSRTKSPNFCRMVFLLQSLNKKNINLDKFRKDTTGSEIDIPQALKAKKFRL